ncbi:MAG: hypothetical protein Q9184_005316 [Pyrenodesmia sp. 2 TL-2023]
MASFIYDTRNHIRDEFWISVSPQGAGGAGQCIVKLLEWPSGKQQFKCIIPAGSCLTCVSVQLMAELDVKKLLQRQGKQLRIIFAPLDFVDPDLPERSQGLQAIYKHFRVPTEFILERSQSVTHSFGSYMDAGERLQAYGKPTYGMSISFPFVLGHEADSLYVCWAHTLSKNIELHFDENGIPFIRDPRGSRQNHGDWTWLRSGYFLRWKNPMADGLHNTEVTLIVFSASFDLKEHLQQLLSRPDWRQGLMDPFGLLVIVAENLFLEISEAINKVLCVLRYTENVCSGANMSSRPS